MIEKRAFPKLIFFSKLIQVFGWGILMFVGCGKKVDKREEAILAAKIYLNKRECTKAIQVLEGIGIDNTNTKYLQTLASAYACPSGFSEPEFYGNNLEKLGGESDSFFGSLTTFSTSKMSSPEDESFVHLQKAIDLLLKAGGITNPSSQLRRIYFEPSEANDIDTQNLYMILTQLGKYLYYYGNADPSTGTKGSGRSSNGNSNGLTNGCLYRYNPLDENLAFYINFLLTTGDFGTCTTIATGHERLSSLPNEETSKRMCQGVVLFNNLLDILSNLELPVENGGLDGLSDVFETVCSAVSYIGSICKVKSQDECERDFSEGVNSDRLQAYFFFIFEQLFK